LVWYSPCRGPCLASEIYVPRLKLTPCLVSHLLFSPRHATPGLAWHRLATHGLACLRLSSHALTCPRTCLALLSLA
jgi:hypothetical protein